MRKRIANASLTSPPAVIAILGAATLVTRIIWRSKTLYTWDSVNFALALERVNIAEQQPHPPGYILYIAAGRLFNFIFSDANTALVTVSILGAIAATCAIYQLCRKIYDGQTAIVAALLALISPLAWFYTEVALTYEIGFALATIAIWLLYELFFERRYGLAAAIFIGVAGGFRQELTLFLTPFLFVGLWRTGFRPALLAFGAYAFAVLSWLVPNVMLAGGVSSYLEAGRTQYEIAIAPHTIFTGLRSFLINLQRVWIALIWLLGVSILAYAYLAVMAVRIKKARIGKQTLFLLAMMVPALAYFLFVDIAQPGYLLVFSAPPLMITARAIVLASSMIFDGQQKIGDTIKPRLLFIVAFLIAAGMVNTYFLFNAPSIKTKVQLTGDGPFGIGGMKRLDKDTQDLMSGVRQFDPDSTAIAVGTLQDWRRLMYYLPEYHVLFLRIDTGANYSDAKDHHYSVSNDRSISFPDNIKRLVLVNLDPQPLKGLQKVTASKSFFAVIADLPQTGSINVGPYEFVRR